MSNTVSDKVVKMTFDNQKFEQNVKTSMSTIDKLKKSLNFDNSAKSFSKLTEEANKVSFKGIEKGIDEVHAHLDVKTMAMFSLVNNLVTKATAMISNMVKELTITPMTTGFNEYELKMGAVQTIMSATGEDIAVVNQYLEELNEYSDRTIYSFADMTQNIGKFTNAGVKLEDAVIAMKGISNEAAVSGASAAEASRAMYNLSQALSMGYVQYIDWKSIENANMATVEFKQNLANTAVELGTIRKTADGLYELNGKSYTLQQLFKDAMKEQWLTTDALIGTLKDYADENTEIGKKAYAAAQDIKTFSMMIDTLKEAMQSGWAMTWQLIIGDLNEAKKLFTLIGNGLGDIISKVSNFTNSRLENGLSSPWRKLMKAINAAGISEKDFSAQLIENLEAAGVPIDKMIEEYGTLEEALRHNPAWILKIKGAIKEILAPLHEVSGGIETAVSSLEEMNDVVNRVIRGEFGNGQKRIEALTAAGYDNVVVQKLVNKIWERNGKSWKDTTVTAEDLASVLSDLSDEERKVVAEAMGGEEALNALTESLVNSGLDLDTAISMLFSAEKTPREMILATAKNLIDSLSAAAHAFGQAMEEVFPSDGGEGIRNFLKSLMNLSEMFKVTDGRADKLRRIFRGLLSVVGIFTDIIGAVGRAFVTVLAPGISTTGDGLLDILAIIGDAIFNFREFINEGSFFIDLFVAIAGAIGKSIKTIISFIQDLSEEMKTGFIEGFYESATPVAGVVQGIVTAIQEGIIWFMKLIGVLDDTSEKTLKASKGWKKFRNVINNITDGIDNFLIKLLGIKEETDDTYGHALSMAEAFSSFGQYMMEGLSSGISNGWSGVKGFIQKIIDKIKNLFTNDKTGFGIHSPSLFFVWVGEMIVAGIKLGLKGVSKVIVWLSSAITKAMNSMTKLSLTDILDRLRNMIDGIRNFLQQTEGPISDLVKKILAWIKTFSEKTVEHVKYLIEFLKTVDWDKVIDTVIRLMNAFGLLKVGLGLSKIGKGFEKFAKYFSKGAASLGKGISSFGKSLKAKYLSSTIKSVAVLIGVITVLMVVISEMPQEDLERSKDVMLELVNTVGGIFILLALINKINVGDNGTLKGLAAFVASLAIATISISLSIKLIIQAIRDMKDILDERDAYIDAIQAVTSMVVALAGITALLSILGKDKSTASSALTVLGIAAALHIIVAAIEKLMNIEGTEKDLKSNFKMIEYMLVTLGGIAVLLSIFGGGMNIGGAATIIAIAYSVKMIADYIIDLNNSLGTMSEGDIWNIALILISFFGGIALMFKAAQGISGGAFAGMTAILISVIVFIASFSAVIQSLQGIEFNGSMVVLLVGLGLLFGGLIALMTSLSVGGKKAKRAAGSLVMLTLFVASLAGLMYMMIGLAGLDFKNILACVGGVIGIIIAMKFISKEAQNLSSDALFGLLGMSVLLGVITIALMDLADIPYQNIKNAIIGIGATMLILGVFLGALMVVAQKFPVGAAALSGVLLSLAAVIVAVGAAMLMGALAFHVLMDAIIQLKDLTGEEMQTIIDNLSIFVYGLITQVLPAAIQGIIDLIVQACVAFVEWLGNLIGFVWEGIVETYNNIVEKFETFRDNAIEWIVGKGEEFGKAGREMIHNIGEGFEKAWDSFKEKLSAFIQKIKDFFSPSHWLEIGSNIGAGLANGLSGEETGLKKVANGVVGGIKNVFTGKKGFDTRSPSKWSEGIGNFVVQGLTNGITDQSKKDDSIIGKVVGGLKDTIVEKIGSPFANLSETLDLSNMLQLPDTLTQPTITPVVDMSNFNTDIGNMSAQMNGLTFDNAAFNSASVNASLASSFVSDTDNTRSILTEIKGLRQDTQNLNDSLANTNLYLDGDALVGGIANRMNTTLGRMVTYRGRGN